MAHDRIVYGIYSWDFVAIEGIPQVVQRTLKAVKQPGVDGVAFKYMANDAQPSRLTLIAVATDQSDEEAWIAAMANLTGRQVSIYSSTGVAYHNQVFHEVAHRSANRMEVAAWANVDLGSTSRLLVFDVTVQYPYGA